MKFRIEVTKDGNYIAQVKSKFGFFWSDIGTTAYGYNEALGFFGVGVIYKNSKEEAIEAIKNYIDESKKSIKYIEINEQDLK